MKVIDPNSGYSLGLDQRYLYGRLANDYWAVWDRDGEIVDIMPKKFDSCLQEHAACLSCYAWNNLSPWPDAETIAAMDATE